MKLSTAKFIAEQASKIAELERGLGDILMTLDNPEHDFIVNDDRFVSVITSKIKEKLNNKT